MLEFVLAGSAVCALTLGSSAVAKLRAPGRASVALVRFGVARRARRGAGRALGALEGVVAIALVAFPTSPLPLAAALGLFTVFAALIARALLRDERFDCGCLGERDTLGTHTLVRALTLAAIAIVAIAMASVDAAAEAVTATDRITALVIGALLVVQVSLVSSLRRWRPFDPALRGTP